MDSFKQEEFKKAVMAIEANSFEGDFKALLESLLHNFQGFYGAYAALSDEEKPQFFTMFNEAMRTYFDLGQLCIQNLLEKTDGMEVDVSLPEPPYSEFVKCVKKILAMPKLEVASANAISDIMGQIESARNMAATQQWSIDGSSMAFLETRMDATTRAMWNFQIRQVGEPKDISGMVNFLIARKLSDFADEKEYSKPVAGPSHLFAQPIAGPSRANMTMRREHSMESLSDTDELVLSCPLCKAAHKLIRCPEFKAKSIVERWDVASYV